MRMVKGLGLTLSGAHACAGDGAQQYQEVPEALPLEETKEKFEVQTISLQGALMDSVLD